MEDTYAQDSIEHELNHAHDLVVIQKGTGSLHEHLKCFKYIYDNLAVIGKPESNQNKVLSLLRGLRSGYKAFVTIMLKPSVPSYKNLIPLLQSYDERIQPHDRQPQFANISQQASNTK